MTNFRDSSIYKYLTKILDAGFILFQENILEDENIDTAWRPHVHKGWEIKFYAPDEGQRKYKFSWIPPGKVHASSRFCDLSFELNYPKIIFGPLHVKEFPNQFFDEASIKINIVPELLLALSKLPISGKYEDLRQNLGKSILENILLVIEQASQHFSGNGKISPFDSAWNYMGSRYFEPNLGVNDIACSSGVTAQYLNRIFRRQTGKSIRQNLIEMRLIHARELLESRRFFVKDVASLTGWNSPFYFCNCFTQYFGYPPSSLLD